MKEHLETLETMPKYVGNNYTEQVLEGIREKNRTDLRRAIREPYFGRLDFQEDGDKEAVPLYIGKIGVANPVNEQPMIIDWRAPVASLFYSFIGGNETAYYESTDGRIEGNVHLKRYIVVRNGELQRVVDDFEKGNERIADDFLLYRLGENKDNRLKDIVSTIQVEQNEIIRAPRNTPILIQGVAGSGKTTVALHRLAYLIYQYQESLRAKKMIIFAPNRLFLDYISDVLPELGVGDIQQTTFQDWAMSILEDEVRLKDARESFAKWFESDSMVEEGKTKRWKGSLSFMHVLAQYIKSYEKNCVPTQDFEAWERKKLDQTIINRWFTVEYKHYPLAKRRERILHRIKAWMDGELKHIGDPKVKKDRKKKATQQLNAYLKYWPNHSALSFYRELFSKLKKKQDISEDILRAIPSDVVQATAASLKKKEMEQEDLAPLVFIHQRLYGVDPNHRYQHIVIDEAQDYSPFQLALLKNLTEQQSLTILGDLSQSIYAYQGIKDWDECKGIFDKSKLQYFELTKSYRSTWEIIRFANEVISQAHLSIQLADPVFRSGEKIKLVQVSEENRILSIVKAVQLLQEKRMNTIALLGRTEAECEALFMALKAKGIPVSLVQAEQENYAGGISIMPVYMSKGLEFDAVLLLDVNDQAYRKTVQDAKLLYVGCTRALHELWLFHGKTPSPLLEGIDEELVMKV
ncbi:HelD family protein [Ammoniphilus resinae]|nr:UvrD-helicase domain-containing protein [Ammoniphilus resinae]